MHVNKQWAAGAGITCAMKAREQWPTTTPLASSGIPLTLGKDGWHVDGPHDVALRLPAGRAPL